MPLNSQITLKKGQVKTFVSDNGDTLITMRIEDAKLILIDILNYQIADSIISEYEAKDKEIAFKDDVIKKQKREIRKQKALKILGFSGVIILPVVTALLLLN